MKLKKVLSILMATALTAAMAACSPPAAETPAPAETAAEATPAPEAPPVQEATPAPTEAPPAEDVFSVAMVTDLGGVNDESFNQSSWEGLLEFEKDTGAKVKYLESKQEADYGPNFDRLADEGHNIIWGVGFMLGDAVKNAAQQNPDMNYAIIDYSYAPEDGANLTGVLFKAEEPSFLVGYIAGKTTKVDKVGFIGGVNIEVIHQFEFGYRAGVAYAAKELGKDIQVEIQYAESFTDDAKGLAIARQMYTNGCDIIFHAAGKTGMGLFEAAKEYNKLCIGVDQDQSSLAPDNTLTSALKLVGKAMYLVSKDVMDGKTVGGQTIVYGLKEGGVGVPESKLVDPAVAEQTKAVEKEIIDGKIVVPANEADFNTFVASLQ